MINLQECKTLQIMPETFRSDVYIQAASYALGKTAQMVLKKIDNTSVYAQIDLLPDKIIDLLAEEFRAQYYDTSLCIEDKREAVKKALLWHCRAGTLSAVKELTNLVWRSDSAQVQEWFEYSSAPYLFRILLETDMNIEEEKINIFLKSLWKVKNTRSHLESITFIRKLNNILYIGAASRSWNNIVITDVWKDEYSMCSSVYVQTKQTEIKRIQIKEG